MPKRSTTSSRKAGSGSAHPFAAVVIADTEHQFVNTGFKVFTGQHRIITTAVVVGTNLGDQFTSGVDTVERNRDIVAGAAVGGVQHMGSQVTSHSY